MMIKLWETISLVLDSSSGRTENATASSAHTNLMEEKDAAIPEVVLNNLEDVEEVRNTIEKQLSLLHQGSTQEVSLSCLQ